MKKLVLMACVMSAMFFASCGNPEADAKKAVDTLKAVVEAKDVDCEKLAPAIKTFDEAIKKVDTAKIENKEVKKAVVDICKKANDKKTELGCN